MDHRSILHGLSAQYLAKLVRRFEAKIAPRNDNGCALWKASTKEGYGQFSTVRGLKPAHRIMFELSGRILREGEEIRHECDQPLCVSPEHLVAGTHAENIADMDRRGRRRAPMGERSGSAKMTADDVRLMFKLRESGATHAELAARFGLSISTVSLTLRKKRWRHLWVA